MKIIAVKTSQGGYDIIFGRNTHMSAGKFFDLNRRVLVVTDDGVPAGYASDVANQCKNGYVLTLKQGEATKNIDSFKTILSKLCELGFTRTDCVVAVGGGVVGDLAGFASACYMRGIDFYNVPTTVLSQVDSSIGGKTAIDFEGYKNIVGAFYQPKRVIIDPDLLLTLDKRQISNGLAEAVKMAATSDEKLFCDIERGNIPLDDVIYRAILIKKAVVEEDEKESGLRRVLNFGHTVAHAVESAADGKLLHGECVAIGMAAICKGEVKKRIEAVLLRLGLPIKHDFAPSQLVDMLKHDKKASGDKITVVTVKNIGSFEFKKIDFDTLLDMTGGAAV